MLAIAPRIVNTTYCSLDCEKLDSDDDGGEEGGRGVLIAEILYLRLDLIDILGSTVEI